MDNSQDKSPAPQVSPKTAATPTAAKKILLVDDDPTSLKLTQEVLRSAGFVVLAAREGNSAWLSMTEENMPQLIIADIMMPEMDGFVFLKQLKSNAETRNIPVVIVSARRHMEDTVLCAGADAFVAKPFSAEELLLTVRKTLSRGGPLLQ